MFQAWLNYTLKFFLVSITCLRLKCRLGCFDFLGEIIQECYCDSIGLSLSFRVVISCSSKLAIVLVMVLSLLPRQEFLLGFSELAFWLIPFIIFIFFLSTDSKNFGQSINFFDWIVGLKNECVLDYSFWLLNDLQQLNSKFYRDFSRLPGFSLTKKLQISGLRGLTTVFGAAQGLLGIAGRMWLLNKFKCLSIIIADQEPQMQTQQYSDQETIQRYTSPTLENLLSQNKMKDLALSKATNLIELLNIELEVERNTSQENIRQIEVDLQRKYESQIQYLREKVSQLEKELRKGTTASQSKQKGKSSADVSGRKVTYSRASSVKSFDNRKKRSVNKKYTENNTNQSGYKNEQILTFTICDKVFKNQMLEMEEWKKNIIAQLDRIVKDEYEELGDLINAIEACSEDFEEVIKESKERSSKNMVAEMGKIIQQQHKIINTWRAYAQELEDLYKSFFFKMQSLYTAQPSKPLFTCQNSFQEVITKMRQKLRSSKLEWQGHISGLEHQNDELKNILDSMIKLVKEEKKIKN